MVPRRGHRYWRPWQFLAQPKYALYSLRIARSDTARPTIPQPLIPCDVPGANVTSVRLAQPVAPTTNSSEKTLHKNTVSAASTPATALDNNGAVDGVVADGDCSDDDDTDDVMAVAISYLEEDCHLLRAQK